ncbi:MAG TPA: hypothetical protein PJ991_08755 [Kiritimatiellia bacterium]|nr:hypothetical protein [Kiritimatiellia bacterium]
MLFANREYVLPVTALTPVEMTWRWRYQHRTLTAGQIEIDGNNPVNLLLPKMELNPGTVWETHLDFALQNRNGNVTTGSFPMALCHDLPGPDFTAAIKNRSILVHDPDNRLASKLRDLPLPHKAVRFPSAAQQDDILIVVPSIDVPASANLLEQLAGSAARGVHVIWLAGGIGSWSISPETEAGKVLLQSNIELLQAEQLRRYVKWLDLSLWRYDETPKWSFQPGRTGLRADISTSAAGWVAAHWQFPGGGSLLFCGLDVINDWDENPGARYLLFSFLRDRSNLKNQGNPDE